MNELNNQVIAEFRVNNCVVRNALGGHFKNIHLLLLHHVGRRSGQEHVTPLLYVEDGCSFLLIGSNGGAPAKEPVWLGNVEAMSEVTIEVGAHTLKAKPTVPREGPERDRRAMPDYCVMIGTIPAGGCVPLHSHRDIESFFL